MEIKLKIVEKEPCPPDEKIKVTMETVDIGGRYAGKRKMKPITMRIAELRKNLDRVVAESELPPFLVEILLGEYLSGVSMVARREYEADRAEWKQVKKMADISNEIKNFREAVYGEEVREHDLSGGKAE